MVPPNADRVVVSGIVDEEKRRGNRNALAVKVEAVRETKITGRLPRDRV